jgi:hypothetical protein
MFLRTSPQETDPDNQRFSTQVVTGTPPGIIFDFDGKEAPI